MADATVVRGSGEGTALWLLGGLYEIKLTGDVVDRADTTTATRDLDDRLNGQAKGRANMTDPTTTNPDDSKVGAELDEAAVATFKDSLRGELMGLVRSRLQRCPHDLEPADRQAPSPDRAVRRCQRRRAQRALCSGARARGSGARRRAQHRR